MFRVTIDRQACAGIFACLARDDRFVEGAEGLATLDPEAAESLHRSDTEVTAVFAEGREHAEQAAMACPPDAITVEDVGACEADGSDNPAEVGGCR